MTFFCKVSLSLSGLAPTAVSLFLVPGAGGDRREIYSLESVLCVLQFWGRFVMQAES